MSDFEIVELPARPVFYLTRTCAPTNEGVGAAMQEGFGALGAFIGQSGITVAGAPWSTYTEMTEDHITFDLSFPTLESEAEKTEGNPDVSYRVEPAVKAAKAIHKGPYEGIAESYQRLAEAIEARGLKPGGPMFESYLNSPGEVADEDLLTEIYQPLAD